jgi:hypothetical protein
MALQGPALSDRDTGTRKHMHAHHDITCMSLNNEYEVKDGCLLGCSAVKPQILLNKYEISTC